MNDKEFRKKQLIVSVCMFFSMAAVIGAIAALLYFATGACVP